MVRVVSGWMNRHQQSVISYLCEEKAVLIEQLGGRPQPFTNSQRIRLAREAKKLERRALLRISPIANVVGFELVELLPYRDDGYTTVPNSERILREAMVGMAMRKKGIYNHFTLFIEAYFDKVG